jgi:hypothetical protein
MLFYDSSRIKYYRSSEVGSQNGILFGDDADKIETTLRTIEKNRMIANFNCQDKDGDTPVLMDVLKGVYILLLHHVNVNILNSLGESSCRIDIKDTMYNV